MPPARGWLLPFLAAVPLCAAPAAVHVPARDYVAVAEREIDAARRSIHLYLYLFSYQPADPDAAPARLARALVRAARRGVQVEIVLDPGDAPQDTPGKNRAAVDFLASQGIPVFYADGPVLHAKALVADDATVLTGSSNWSVAAFTDNAEADVLVHSPPLAAALLKELSAVPRRAPPPAVPTLEVPAEVLFREDGLGAMVSHRDERSLDAWLHLLHVNVSTASETPVPAASPSPAKPST